MDMDRADLAIEETNRDAVREACYIPTLRGNCKVGRGLRNWSDEMNDVRRLTMESWDRLNPVNRTIGL